MRCWFGCHGLRTVLRDPLSFRLLELSIRVAPRIVRIYTLRGFESVLAGSVQVSTGTKTSLSFQDGPVFTRVHRREGPAAPRGSRARTHGTTISQPTWPGVPQIAFIRLTGRAPGQQPFEILEDLVGYVATELNANPRDLDLYARRQPTLSAHLERVREHLGLTAFDEKARQRLAPFVFKEAFRLEQGAALVSRCEEYLREKDILCPARSTLRRIVHEQRERARTEIFSRVLAAIPPSILTRLDALLEVAVPFRIEETRGRKQLLFLKLRTKTTASHGTRHGSGNILTGHYDGSRLHSTWLFRGVSVINQARQQTN